MGRVSRAQAASNRAAVVAAASSLFRREGLGGVGIADVMAEAGLTHGGFYGQFDSKEQLAAEAMTHAFGTVADVWSEVGEGDERTRLARLVSFYLVPKPVGRDCPMAALAGDAARHPPGGAVHDAFTTGLRHLIELTAGSAPADEVLAVFAAMVGAAILRRASDDAAMLDAMDAAVVRLAERADAEASR